MNDEPDGRTIRADDPRLSEWIDGRLPAAEAAIVARSVAESPELTRVVADLRRLKALLAAAPARPAPAGFVADVLTALDAPPRLAPGTAAASGGGPADSRIDAEWERIELERLADEIAEAREDAAMAETTAEPRRPWPWMTMLAALAAGLLVASFVNMPPLHSVLVEKDRDVALRGAGHPQEGLSRTVDEFFAESDGDAAAEAKPAEARSHERSAAKRNTDLAADDLVKNAAPLAAAPAAENMQDEYGLAAGKNRTRKEALAESTESQSTAKKGAAMLGSPTPGSGNLAANTSAAEGGGGGGGGGGIDPRSRENLAESFRQRRDTTAPVVVVVRGPEGRAEFSALLAARNIGFTRRPAEKMRELLAGKAATKPGAPPASAEGERREAGKADDLERNGLPKAPQTGLADRAAVESMSGTEEVIAISGSPAAIGELLAFLEAGRGNGLDVKVGGSAEALKRLARGEAKQDVAVDKPAADRARGAGGPAGETLDRNAVDGEERARPPAKVDTAAEASVTVLVRLVDIAPGNQAAGPTAAAVAVPAQEAAPAAGEAQGAGERQTP
jgi:hypothetical protein